MQWKARNEAQVTERWHEDLQWKAGLIEVKGTGSGFSKNDLFY
ncbi:hypothetical protein [Solitalea agri]|nr:hypothetical protein [Solitalea agri]